MKLLSIVAAGLCAGLSFMVHVRADNKGTCEGLLLRASLEQSEPPRGDERAFSVSLENNGQVPIAIRRDKVASTIQAERLTNGRWKVIGGSGIGRGVGSSSAKPPTPTQDQIVKQVLQDYVVLYPHEVFTEGIVLNPFKFDATGGAAPRGQYRVSFVYVDDQPEKAPVYPSNCKLRSNVVRLIAK